MGDYKQPSQAQALSMYPDIRPLWGELKFVCARYGLSKGKIYEMIRSRQIVVKNVISVDEAGFPKSRGRLLVNLDALEDYLDSLPEMTLD